MLVSMSPSGVCFTSTTGSEQHIYLGFAVLYEEDEEDPEQAKA